MPVATLTSKGQITIPAEVRQALGLTRGERVDFEPLGDGYLMTVSRRGIERIAGFFGPYQGQPVSLEQMNRDIVQAAR